jgi:hypothetical protein
MQQYGYMFATPGKEYQYVNTVVCHINLHCLVCASEGIELIYIVWLWNAT